MLIWNSDLKKSTEGNYREDEKYKKDSMKTLAKELTNKKINLTSSQNKVWEIYHQIYQETERKKEKA
jgi:hypothetical protein